MNGTDVQATLREMWETRPARPRHDRKVAGVAAAIARRYDIDPVLVRVGFVVAALYGIGAALYIAGWVLLPEADEDDPTDGAAHGQAAGRAGRPNPILLIALVIAAMVGVGAVFGRDGGVVLPALAVLGLLFLLHRSRGSRGIAGTGGAPHPGTGAPSYGGGPGADPDAESPTVATPAPGAPVDLTKAAAEAPTTATDATAGIDPITGAPRPTPPAWDPLGAAPFAWDLPEPAPASPPAPPMARRRRRTPVTAVTLAVALLASGLLGALLLLGDVSLSLPMMFGIVLAVLGTGLVVGAFTRSGRGLIPFALVLALLTWASMHVPVAGLHGGVGEVREAPTSIAVLAPEYHRSVGSIELDLRGLDLSVPPGTDAAALPPATTTASVGMGEVSVRVPANADVTVHGSAGLGHVQFETREGSGNNPSVTVVDDLGTDGVRSGRAIELNLNAGVGNVEVLRG